MRICEISDFKSQISSSLANLFLNKFALICRFPFLSHIFQLGGLSVKTTTTNEDVMRKFLRKIYYSG